MANSRRSRPVDPRRGPAAPPASARTPRAAPGVPRKASSSTSCAADPVARAIAAALPAWKSLPNRAGAKGRTLRVAVGLSGGCDSMVLLDALAECARDDRAIGLQAIHVHHGLSPNADAWAEFCRTQCARRGVPLVVHRVTVARDPGASLEAAARVARLAALARADADVIALAHHADDQAETVLLQLLRGAGPKGLAGMPACGLAPGGAALARPLLALARSEILASAHSRGLEWIDDESNADTDVRRNFLRHEIAPRLAQAFPGYPGTLVRAARHQAEAALLADELAAGDADGAIAEDSLLGTTLSRDALAAFALQAPHRARNLLRWFLRRHGLRAPSSARLAAMLDQLVHAAADARVALHHDGAVLGVHRGRIGVHSAPAARFALAWHGESEIALPHGKLEFAPTQGEGLAAAALRGAAVTIRSRIGGERICLVADRTARSLKRLLHEAGIPQWQRADLPLVWCGEILAAVPGLGIAATFRSEAGAPAFELRWHPHRAHGAARQGASDPC